MFLCQRKLLMAGVPQPFHAQEDLASITVFIVLSVLGFAVFFCPMLKQSPDVQSPIQVIFSAELKDI